MATLAQPFVTDTPVMQPERRRRLAVVVSHPIQYFAPWFAHIASTGLLDLRVFHLWDFGVTARVDRDFGVELRWDVPLLDGYESELVPNRSGDPGTHHFAGLDNPALVDRLAAWSPDAILLFGYGYRSHLRVLFSRRLRPIPILFRGDSHDIARDPGVRALVSGALRRVAFRRLAACLAVGEANRSYFANSGVAPERVFFAPHAVDNERFRAAAASAHDEARAWKEDLGIGAMRPVVLFAGKLEAKKRPVDLLQAFVRAFAGSDERSRPALLFVGSGALETSLRNIAGDEAARSVFFAPFQNQSRMPLVYAASDVFVLPSASETWGLAVNEAMNLARPAVVSSHVGCAPDLVIEGETGWVFEAGDVDALARTLADALSDRERLVRMGEAARRRVALYSYDAATAGLLAALGAVVQGGSV